jgi:nucleoside-diphosphate-sugar epimerase
MNKKKRILITGGSGLIGQNLTNKLVEEGYKNVIVSIHNTIPRIQYDNVKYVKGDLTEMKYCLEITKDVDVVFHCAAFTTNAVDTQLDPLAHVTNNVVVNNYLIDASYKNKVGKYIFMSSSSVYPDKKDQAVKESDFLFDEPFPIYYPVGWMKRYAEVQCTMYSKFVPDPMLTIIIRPANLFGPHDKFDFNKCHVTPATIRKVADKMNPIPVWGDGTELRDILFVEDFIDALLIIMEKQEEHDTFNIGSNTTYSVNDVLYITKKVANYDAPIEYVKGKPSMIPIRRIDSNKIREKLGWEPKTSIEDALEKTLNWYLENKKEFNN